MRGRKFTAAPSTVTPIPEPDPLDRLREVLAYLDGAREALEELGFTCDEATSAKPLMTRKSLREAGRDDMIDGIRQLRAAQREIEAVQDQLVRGGAR
jgi:hypothetical protein